MAITDTYLGIPVMLWLAIGVTVVVMIFFAVYFYFTGWKEAHARKKALEQTKGKGSATPTRMQPKTNPRYTREEEFVDITGEPNPFLGRDRK